MATLMDGRAVGQRILDACAEKVKAIVAATGTRPCLATVLVGDDPASVTYTRMKRTRSEAVGMRSLKVELAAASTTEDVVARVAALAEEPSVHGILVQHPVPRHVDERSVFEAVPPTKDVDGLTLASFGGVSFGLPGVGYGSCTPEGIVRLLEAYHVELSGRRAVVIGRSPILGKPMAMMLLARDATVTICHSRTRDLGAIVAEADVVVAAVGKARFIQGAWIKPGAVVIDAGYNAGNIGDVDFEPAAERASLITPVPGGVGPLTLAVLIDHTATAAARQLGVTL
ncbi:MAG: bifunctional 5,10-methylene-tetrahydrofolate dehydrogenase/5,10-methylene-tetrahydrofolate cyclohydrolase [Candidatus Rokuibacteriota bacterium]|nr:MAG: bifunctional 5,10-methylene-tetrahydrofolate dehydrogenase/5,10-methylene-tetrahydrofolate cyclohydrolase [Candidatus Rokubacteria bacterium]